MNKKNTGNQDEQEKARKLSEDEQKRLEAFEQLSEGMVREGYRRVELTVSIRKANWFAVLLLIPLFVVGFGLFFLRHHQITEGFHVYSFFIAMAVYLILVVVHELIHGLSWSIFAEHHWKDIAFGFMTQYLTPYCSCRVPLSKGQYIFGALMPLVILGILPMIAGILSGSILTLFVGIIMADAAAGDILIVWNLLKYRSEFCYESFTSVKNLLSMLSHLCFQNVHKCGIRLSLLLQERITLLKNLVVCHEMFKIRVIKLRDNKIQKTSTLIAPATDKLLISR